MGASALVLTLPGCVVPGCGESPHSRSSCAPNWVPPGSLKARVVRASLSASSSSEGELDSRDGEAGPGSGEGRSTDDAGAGSESASVDSVRKSEAKENGAQSALERTMAYKKTKGLAGMPIQSRRASPQPGSVEAGEPKLESEAEQGGSAAALSAFERAKAYKLQQSEMIAALNESQTPEAATPPVENVVEIEIHTRDGIVRRKVLKPETAFANVKDMKKKGVSTMDFVGLGFADKKSTSSRPAGLSTSFEAPTGPLPEVEIMTRDAGVADPDAMAGAEGDDVYKPRVTTWGMFPRPADISKAYGGGRNIKPGQKLETEEERVARETKTKKLLDDYRKKLGLDMAPKDRARCERTMKEGENLMDKGQLREAEVAFLTVMDEMPFPTWVNDEGNYRYRKETTDWALVLEKGEDEPRSNTWGNWQSELHGMAALQEAVCLDSLNRSDEAKSKYEKLVSHPNGAVRKKARQLLFGFQAAEKLKVRAGYNWDSSSYRKYFDAFADGYNTMYKKSEDSADGENSLMETLPYALLLIFPVILLFTLVALKNA